MHFLQPNVDIEFYYIERIKILFFVIQLHSPIYIRASFRSRQKTGMRPYRSFIALYMLTTVKPIRTNKSSLHAAATSSRVKPVSLMFYLDTHQSSSVVFCSLMYSSVVNAPSTTWSVMRARRERSYRLPSFHHVLSTSFAFLSDH